MQSDFGSQTTSQSGAEQSRRFSKVGNSNWLRLRTLIFLRWLAIAGQMTAIVAGQRYFDLQLELAFCFFAIGVSVMANLLAVFIFPENKRLNENEAFFMILFDLAQLSFLLFLTGGLNNPFALLLLAPVTISATALGGRETVVLGMIALIFVTLLAFFHFPLRTENGFIHRMPQVLLFGFWSAMAIGIVFIALYARRVTEEMNDMSEALVATQMALARGQKMTDLGAVVAATAHELGTPLATIKLVSQELIDELGDNEDLRDDAALIRDQADRCRDILRSMGRAGNDDLHLRTAPLSAVMREAAEPHLDRGKTIHFDFLSSFDPDLAQPTIFRKPEVIHGMRNLIQNAVDFSDTQIWIEGDWSDQNIKIRIVDDGDGFSSQVFNRIGDPFVRRRAENTSSARPGYEGMGLGLFIAKTLLETSGAKLRFANGTDPFLTSSEVPEQSGAIVEVVWPVEKIVSRLGGASPALGRNQPLEI
ncbi:sensor histidine kinase RegB [Nereida sp. MMG025]|uniref:sensor histidine kinase RegB n=1 Tax=Nereida sp. MMG025 TaxID=2909981 RepID=UPI001F00E5B3|nr:ActS/PrrB/RegB family redox-sensitive histidine kinase [Nereida sp. MMG025]MCF6444642.1 ActS/PrrB/RegB family redox-sensitive histidine kinase [Nereida sp. MMG025]